MIARGDIMKKIIAEEKITSFVFYNKLVPQVLEKLSCMENGEEFVLDFSKTESVDAMAIPLLLNMARWIINIKKTIPQIYIPSLKEKDRLKRYLEQVGFFNACDFYDYYEVNTERVSVKRDSDNSATYIFTENAKNDSQEERERIEEYVYTKLRSNSYSQFWNYWFDYDISKNLDNPDNGVEKVTRAICSNTGIHTKENAVLTLQRNKALQRVCISTADCGQGLYYTLKEKMMKEKFVPVLLSVSDFEDLSGEKADLYAIIEALTYRFMDKKYGLYHVLMKNIELGKEKEKKRKGNLGKENSWAMRIHTNQKRMVLTERNCKGLEKAASKEEFAKKLLVLAESEYVAKDTSNYPGVHVEIEIPYDEETLQNGLLED